MPDKSKRIDIIDAIRGFAIIAMVFYHALYDITDIFGIPVNLFSYLMYLEPPFAGAFILLSGVSSRFSHSNAKRGVRVLLLGVLLTLITAIFMPDQAIYFGILHFLGCAILLFALIKPAVDKIPPIIAFPLWILLFVATYMLPQTYNVGFPHLLSFALPQSFIHSNNFYNNNIFSFLSAIHLPSGFGSGASAALSSFISTLMAAIGLPNQDFFSADYFPVLPWFFLFLAGTVAGIPVQQKKLPEKFYTTKVPFLAFAGRNTLLIYVIHQPIIYGLLSLIFKVF